MNKFSAVIEIIGVNPFVRIPDKILIDLQQDAKKERGPIPVKGTLNGKPYIQTVVKFQGLWRLYLNTPMRTATNTTVGDTVIVEVEFDPTSREIPIPKLFLNELNKDKIAKKAFEKLPHYRQK